MNFCEYLCDNNRDYLAAYSLTADSNFSSANLLKKCLDHMKIVANGDLATACPVALSTRIKNKQTNKKKQKQNRTLLSFMNILCIAITL